MDYKDAAKLVNKIRPEYVVPTHYGSLVGNPSDGENFKTLVDEEIKVVIML